MVCCDFIEEVRHFCARSVCFQQIDILAERGKALLTESLGETPLNQHPFFNEVDAILRMNKIDKLFKFLIGQLD